MEGLVLLLSYLNRLPALGPLLLHSRQEVWSSREGNHCFWWLHSVLHHTTGMLHSLDCDIKWGRILGCRYWCSRFIVVAWAMGCMHLFMCLTLSFYLKKKFSADTSQNFHCNDEYCTTRNEWRTTFYFVYTYLHEIFYCWQYPNTAAVNDLKHTVINFTCSWFH